MEKTTNVLTSTSQNLLDIIKGQRKLELETKKLKLDFYEKILGILKNALPKDFDMGQIDKFNNVFSDYLAGKDSTSVHIKFSQYRENQEAVVSQFKKELEGKVFDNILWFSIDDFTSTSYFIRINFLPEEVDSSYIEGPISEVSNATKGILLNEKKFVVCDRPDPRLGCEISITDISACDEYGEGYGRAVVDSLYNHKWPMSKLDMVNELLRITDFDDINRTTAARIILVTIDNMLAKGFLIEKDDMLDINFQIRKTKK